MGKPADEPKMGRPPLPEEERMDKILKIRLSAAELAELKRAADGDTSTWAREVLLRAAKRK